MIRVVLADDHVQMRARIRAALEGDGCEVCAEAGNADDAVAFAKEHRPDVALLDIHMPGSGIRAAEEISRTLPGTAIVMLTASDEEEDLFGSLRAGARGYLLKHVDADGLGESLRRVVAGGAAMSPPLAARIMQEFRAPPRQPRRGSGASDGLSAREWEVMELLADGASTDEAARRLFVSPATVRFHVASVVRKLQVPDRHSAIGLFRRVGRSDA